MRFTDSQSHFIDKHVKRQALKSILDDIDGIGNKRKTLLLRSFGSIKKMKEATLEDFKNIGISENVAKNLHEQLHK